MSSRVKTSSRTVSRAKKSMRSEAPPGKRAREVTSRAKLTITDIAHLAGVSKKTVSRVINQEPYVNKKTARGSRPSSPSMAISLTRRPAAWRFAAHSSSG